MKINKCVLKSQCMVPSIKTGGITTKSFYLSFCWSSNFSYTWLYYMSWFWFSFTVLLTFTVLRKASPKPKRGFGLPKDAQSAWNAPHKPGPLQGLKSAWYFQFWPGYDLNWASSLTSLKSNSTHEATTSSSSWRRHPRPRAYHGSWVIIPWPVAARIYALQRQHKWMCCDDDELLLASQLVEHRKRLNQTGVIKTKKKKKVSGDRQHSAR